MILPYCNNRAHSFVWLIWFFPSNSVIKLRHQADDHTNHRSFLNFCQILRNSTDISKFHEKWQIAWLSLKFRGPRKNVGRNHHHHHHVRLMKVDLCNFWQCKHEIHPKICKHLWEACRRNHSSSSNFAYNYTFLRSMVCQSVVCHSRARRWNHWSDLDVICRVYLWCPVTNYFRWGPWPLGEGKIWGSHFAVQTWPKSEGILLNLSLSENMVTIYSQPIRMNSSVD